MKKNKKRKSRRSSITSTNQNDIVTPLMPHLKTVAKSVGRDLRIKEKAALSENRSLWNWLIVHHLKVADWLMAIATWTFFVCLIAFQVEVKNVALLTAVTASVLYQAVATILTTFSARNFINRKTFWITVCEKLAAHYQGAGRSLNEAIKTARNHYLAIMAVTLGVFTVFATPLYARSEIISRVAEVHFWIPLAAQPYIYWSILIVGIMMFLYFIIKPIAWLLLVYHYYNGATAK